MHPEQHALGGTRAPRRAAGRNLYPERNLTVLHGKRNVVYLIKAEGRGTDAADGPAEGADENQRTNMLSGAENTQQGTSWVHDKNKNSLTLRKWSEQKTRRRDRLLARILEYPFSQLRPIHHVQLTSSNPPCPIHFVQSTPPNLPNPIHSDHSTSSNQNYPMQYVQLTPINPLHLTNPV